MMLHPRYWPWSSAETKNTAEVVRMKPIVDESDGNDDASDAERLNIPKLVPRVMDNYDSSDDEK